MYNKPQINPVSLQQTKKCNHLPIIIILVLLLIGACGFGGYELWQGMQKDTEIIELIDNAKGKDIEIAELKDKEKEKEIEIAELKEEIKDAQNTEIISNTKIEEENIDNTISISEAEEILARYFGEAGKPTISVTDLIPSYRMLQKFNEENRVYFAYKSVPWETQNEVDCIDEYYEDTLCSKSSISFKVLDEKYKSFFGDYSSIEKKNYVFKGSYWNYAALVYDKDLDSYRIFVNGSGGHTSLAGYKVTTIKRDGKNMIVTISMVEVTNYTIGIECPLFTIENINSYKITLSPYNDTYVLTDITRD